MVNLKKIFYDLYYFFCELMLKVILRLMGFNNPNEKKNGEFRFINDYLNKKNPTYIDVGAHVGSHIDEIYKISQNPIIYAFEPNYNNFVLLKEKYNDKKNFHLYNYGLENKAKNFLFYIDLLSTGEGTVFKDVLYDINFSRTAFSNKINQRNIIKKKIGLKQLSKFIKVNPISKIDLIKIDAEGSEINIIEDLFDNLILKNYKVKINYIMFELSYNYIYQKKTLFNLKKYQQKTKFKIYRILPNYLKEINFLETNNHSIYLKSYQNILLKF